jgi:hypothetical protein
MISHSSSVNRFVHGYFDIHKDNDDRIACEKLVPCTQAKQNVQIIENSAGLANFLEIKLGVISTQ